MDQRKQMWKSRTQKPDSTSVIQEVIITLSLELYEEKIERRVFEGHCEAILTRLGHFCRICGSSSLGHYSTGSSAFVSL